MAQLGIWDIRSQDCPFEDFIEEDDNHCFSLVSANQDYEVIGEDHPRFAEWLADIRNVGFNDIVAKDILNLNLPSFIPGIRRGSQKLLKDVIPPFVAISLGDIIKGNSLSMPDEIRSRFGIHPQSKLILLCYGKDRLIENVWTQRKVIFPKIASLGFDLVTAVNYSVWFNQPHGERLINLKRTLITFNEFQDLGIPAIPHMYWFGRKDILRWCDWFSKNKNVNFVAINLQTERERGNKVWDKTLEDIKFFISNMDRPLHFLITGPSVPKRIKQLKIVIPNFSLTNGNCARKAAFGFIISSENGDLLYNHSQIPKNEIMKMNLAFYQRATKKRYPESFYMASKTSNFMIR